ncbi:unnamed protein product [Calypogeia fissa]
MSGTRRIRDFGGCNPQCNPKLDPSQLGINNGLKSPSIICALKDHSQSHPSTSELFIISRRMRLAASMDATCPLPRGPHGVALVVACLWYSRNSEVRELYPLAMNCPARDTSRIL